MTNGLSRRSERESTSGLLNDVNAETRFRCKSRLMSRPRPALQAESIESPSGIPFVPFPVLLDSCSYETAWFRETSQDELGHKFAHLFAMGCVFQIASTDFCETDRTHAVREEQSGRFAVQLLQVHAACRYRL